MSKFQPGNPGPTGRRNRSILTKKVVDDILDSWKKNGAAALEICFREKPDVYLRTIVSVLPKELVIEDVMSDVSDEQLDDLMARIKEHLLAKRSDEEVEQSMVH